MYLLKFPDVSKIPNCQSYVLTYTLSVARSMCRYDQKLRDSIFNERFQFISYRRQADETGILALQLDSFVFKNE